VLVLDGAIQATERDEFSYQEMICHLPMCAHPNPKRALVIGGGDGGVLRELCRHECLEEIVICELDRAVPAASRRFLPQMAAGFDDPRVTVHFMDGAEFMNQHQEYFDIIITDSSDPVGPASVLFEKPFYEKMCSALREGGIVCTQGESLWLHLHIIKEMIVFCKELPFAHVEYAYCTIPTYPSGQIGFVICSKGGSCKKPARQFSHPELRYYNADIHCASFVLPEFARKEILS
jgi:spermidine synthase